MFAIVSDVPDSDGLLTSAEAAARLKIRKRTLLRRVESGSIPFVRKLHEPNGAYLFNPAVIDLLVRQQSKVASGAEMS